MLVESTTENKILMYQAREKLMGNWGLAVGAAVVYFVISFGLQYIPIVGSIISLLISGAMSIGLASLALSISRDRETDLSEIFIGFQKFGTGLGAFLLIMIFIFLWSLLFIIPGIIAALSYSMTFFIIAETDSIGSMEALNISKEIMRGNKWKLFCLYFRFVGWLLLCTLTFGIGFIFLSPYIYVSHAQFYNDLKETDRDLFVRPQISE